MSTLYPTKAGLDLKNGKFTNGNDAAGILPSVLDADHINLLTDNMQGAIQGAGLTPDNQGADQLQKSMNWAAGLWQEGAKYLAGQESLYSGVLYTATAPHTATAANAPGQQGAPWLRSDARTTALEATNIGKTGNQPIVKFTANDWKDRPIGWHGIIAPGSAGSPETTANWYVEKVSNRNTANGYHWQAYPVAANSYFYVGHNDEPATQNGGLPYWEKYESANKKVYSGSSDQSDKLDTLVSTAANGHHPSGKIRDVLRVPVTGMYLVFVHGEGSLVSAQSSGAYLSHWWIDAPVGKPDSLSFAINGVNTDKPNASNMGVSATNVVYCRFNAGELIKYKILVQSAGTIMFESWCRAIAIKVGD